MKSKELEKIVSYIPYFENIDPDKACQWKSSEKSGFPYPVYEEKFSQFISDFSHSGLAVGDYPDKLNQMIPDWQTADINKVVETADFELVRVIFTKCVRVERFHDGAWDSAIRSGLFLVLLNRLNKLLDT
jgi:hypothetical protein